MSRKFQFLTALWVLAATVFSCKKETTTVVEEKYFPKVKVIVQDNCTSNCHSPAKGLLQGLPIILDTDDDLVARAEAIKKSVADPVSIFPRNLRMPEKAMLSDADIAVIKNWFAKGGKATD